MRKILIATHGEFAGGLKQTMDFVLGGNEKVGVLSAYTTPDFDMGREAAAVVDELEDGDELIVLTDVLGGSVANAFSGHISHPGFTYWPASMRPCCWPWCLCWRAPWIPRS